jgi:hypothetical protein
MAKLLIVFHNFANESKNEFVKEIKRAYRSYMYIYIYMFSKTINEYNRPLIKTTIAMDNVCHY